MKMGIRKNFHTMSLGPPNPGFMQEKVQKWGFSKKALTGVERLFLFLDLMNPSKAWKGKVDVASFFAT